MYGTDGETKCHQKVASLDIPGTKMLPEGHNCTSLQNLEDYFTSLPSSNVRNSKMFTGIKTNGENREWAGAFVQIRHFNFRSSCKTTKNNLLNLRNWLLTHPISLKLLCPSYIISYRDYKISDIIVLERIYLLQPEYLLKYLNWILN